MPESDSLKLQILPVGISGYENFGYSYGKRLLRLDFVINLVDVENLLLNCVQNRSFCKYP